MTPTITGNKHAASKLVADLIAANRRGDKEAATNLRRAIERAGYRLGTGEDLPKPANEDDKPKR
ncbi:MAG: hypothetical protein FJ304_20830 [Planctomycetes bacterium]|nr:hypothetical protein [Planctomycetota bacterium]